MSIYKIAEQFVINKLKKLENGRLRLSNHDGEVFNFGKNSSPLNADIMVCESSHTKECKTYKSYFEK